MSQGYNTYRKPNDPVIGGQIRVCQIFQRGKAQGEIITRSSQDVYQSPYKFELQESATDQMDTGYV
jgi:hypothetical protein